MSWSSAQWWQTPTWRSIHRSRGAAVISPLRLALLHSLLLSSTSRISDQKLRWSVCLFTFRTSVVTVLFHCFCLLHFCAALPEILDSNNLRVLNLIQSCIYLSSPNNNRYFHNWHLFHMYCLIDFKTTGLSHALCAATPQTWDGNELRAQLDTGFFSSTSQNPRHTFYTNSLSITKYAAPDKPRLLLFIYWVFGSLPQNSDGNELRVPILAHHLFIWLCQMVINASIIDTYFTCSCWFSPERLFTTCTVCCHLAEIGRQRAARTQPNI